LPSETTVPRARATGSPRCHAAGGEGRTETRPPCVRPTAPVRARTYSRWSPPPRISPATRGKRQPTPIARRDLALDRGGASRANGLVASLTADSPTTASPTQSPACSVGPVPIEEALRHAPAPHCQRQPCQKPG